MTQFFERREKADWKRLTIAVPYSCWDETKSWLSEFSIRWEKAAPGAEFFGVRLESSVMYELIATESHSVVLLPPIAYAPDLDAVKLLEFRRSAPSGIGSWLNLQFEHVMSLQPSLGYSPPRQHDKGAVSEETETAAQPEELV